MKQNSKTKFILIAIILIGILIRLIFMLDAPIYTIQYDIGLENMSKDIDYDSFFELDRNYVKENGNMEYLITVYKTGHMLESNTNQGYHPPLHHYIAAGVMRFCDLFGASSKFKLEAAEFPAFMYSILIIVIIYKMTRELELKDGATIIVMTLAAFNPLLIFLSRHINNDPLVTLCICITMLYLIKWYKQPNMKYTIVLALAIGLGASSKISIIVMMLPLFITYLVKLQKEIDNFDMVKKILVYGLVFGVIATPLVFWYPIRNAIKFSQPPFGIAAASSEFSVAHTDFVNRWLINNEFFSDKLELMASNVWCYVLNSSIIFVLDIAYLPHSFLNCMRIISLALIVLSIIAMIKYFRTNYIYTMLEITSLAWLISFISFNISLPYSCTMHSRYIVTLYIIGMIFIGKLFESTNKKWLKVLISILVILYCIGTVAIFAKIFHSV